MKTELLLVHLDYFQMLVLHEAVRKKIILSTDFLKFVAHKSELYQLHLCLFCYLLLQAAVTATKTVLNQN